MMIYGSLTLADSAEPTSTETTWVQEQLKKSFKRKEFRPPGDGAIARLAGRIFSYKRHPITQPVAEELKRIALRAQAERDILNKAAALLSHDRQELAQHGACQIASNCDPFSRAMTTPEMLAG